jgi:Flp pilus assembly protein TadD
VQTCSDDSADESCVLYLVPGHIDFSDHGRKAPVVQELHEKIERSLLKIFVTVFCLLLLLGFGGYFSLTAFQSWQVRRLLAEANALVKEGNYDRASLAARRVLELDPENADAMRVIARLAESAGLRNAVELWRRVTELSGYAEGDVTSWARCAIRFGDASVASKALDRMPEHGKGMAQYHALRSDVALIRHDLVTREKELLEARRIDPQDKKVELALAALHLAANDIATHENGVRELTDLCADASLRRDALHGLADDALRRNDITHALKYGRELDRLPNCDFSDHLLLLSILKAAADPQMQPVLEQLEVDAAADLSKISALMAWMNAHKSSTQVVVWAKTLPAAMLRQRAVPLNVADALIATGDWNGLLEFCAAAKWETVDYIRNALMAKALRETGRDSTQQWNEALSKINPRSQQIFALAELAQKWGWEKEALDLWWLAAKAPNQAEKTLRILYDFYAGRQDTAELYRVLVRLEKMHPNDWAIGNNLAQISLLLHLEPDRAFRLAHEVHQQQPKNVDFAATYAFALYLQGDVKKASQVIGGFSETELERPQIAAYYGVILAGNGDFSRAAKFLDLGAKANLLPEERKLVEKAQLTIARR